MSLGHTHESPTTSKSWLPGKLNWATVQTWRKPRLNSTMTPQRPSPAEDTPRLLTTMPFKGSTCCWLLNEDDISKAALWSFQVTQAKRMQKKQGKEAFTWRYYSLLHLRARSSCSGYFERSVQAIDHHGTHNPPLTSLFIHYSNTKYAGPHQLHGRLSKKIC